MSELKKVDTLFHTTNTKKKLLSILKGGFQVSFSQEMFKGKPTSIPMVSFSNILLFESESQVNYGEYSIGLSKEWGAKNKLHPVFYTYDESEYENSLDDLRTLSEAGKHVYVFGKFKKKINFSLKTKNAEYKALYDEMIKNLDNAGREVVSKFFSQVKPVFLNFELFTKKIVATNKKGKKFICFNDREWRYFPQNVQDAFIYYPVREKFKTVEEFGKAEEKFKAHLVTHKETYKKEKLGFNLSDLKFVVVKKSNQIKDVYDVLFKTFGKESVMLQVLNGSLLITSRESAFHNL